MPKLKVGDEFSAAKLLDTDSAIAVPCPGNGLCLRVRKVLPEKIQVLGVGVAPGQEGRKLRERVTRDCQEDRPHIQLDPYPLRLLVDLEAKLIRAVGAENEGHWAGQIAAPVTYVVDRAGNVRWGYVSVSAADRPSPVALAKVAASVARGEEPPADYPGKT
jgi:hypothetical protein